MPETELLYTPPSALNTFHNWSRLPTELRLSVLSYVVSFRIEMTWAKHTRLFQEGELNNIIRTNNRDLVNLALETYYKSNTFNAVIFMKLSFYFFIDHPPLIHARHIRTLNVFIESWVPDDSTNIMLHAYQPWYCICKPSDSLEEDTHWSLMSEANRTKFWHWQPSFSGLRRLRLYLKIEDPERRKTTARCTWCRLDSSLSENVMNAFADGNVELKAPKVTINTKTYGHNRKPATQCACFEPMNSLIVDKMTVKR
jgi:hypothetical protein